MYAVLFPLSFLSQGTGMSGCAVEASICSDVQLKQPDPTAAVPPSTEQTSIVPNTKQPVTVRTPQIHWHGKSPVFAIDFHPHLPRLCATGGSEPDGTGGIHLWLLNDGENAIEVSSLASCPMAGSDVRLAHRPRFSSSKTCKATRNLSTACGFAPKEIFLLLLVTELLASQRVSTYML
eukprot:661871-Hanusia_phi.AAC.7